MTSLLTSLYDAAVISGVTWRQTVSSPDVISDVTWRHTITSSDITRRYLTSQATSPDIISTVTRHHKCPHLVPQVASSDVTIDVIWRQTSRCMTLQVTQYDYVWGRKSFHVTSHDVTVVTHVSRDVAVGVILRHATTSRHITWLQVRHWCTSTDVRYVDVTSRHAWSGVSRYEYDLWSLKCPLLLSSKGRILFYKTVKCDVWSVNCEVWSMKC